MAETVKISNEHKMMVKEKALQLTKSRGRTVTMQEVVEKTIKLGLPQVDELVN